MSSSQESRMDSMEKKISQWSTRSSSTESENFLITQSTIHVSQLLNAWRETGEVTGVICLLLITEFYDSVEDEWVLRWLIFFSIESIRDSCLSTRFTIVLLISPHTHWNAIITTITVQCLQVHSIAPCGLSEQEDELELPEEEWIDDEVSNNFMRDMIRNLNM